jgi:hypothetical protein
LALSGHGGKRARQRAPHHRHASLCVVSGDRCYWRARWIAIVSVFLDRTHDQLFDVLDRNVIASLDADLLAYVLGLFRLARHVETVAAGDRDRSIARNNQIDAALVALSGARLILLILLVLLIGYAESNRRGP